MIEVPAGKFAGTALVLDPGWDPDNPRPYVLTQQRQARRLGPMDFPEPVEALARMRVPKSFNGRNPQQRRDLADALRTRAADIPPPHLRASAREDGRAGGPDRATTVRVSDLRARMKAHPCHGCGDREDHARWAERHAKLERDSATLRRRVENRTNTVARQFDRVCEVLAALGYLDGDEVTAEGARLRRIYSEMDLVAAESLRQGLWDGLTSSGLAAALSVLVFEARRPDDARSPRVPGGSTGVAIDAMMRLWGDLDGLEKQHHLDFLRRPDAGFAWCAFRWAEGDDLDDVLGTTDLTAGDFVRWMKQLVDLAGQVATAAGPGPLRDTARSTVKQLKRGVVAYSGLAD